MSSQGPSIFNHLLNETKLDIQQVVSGVFSGALGFPGLPACVSDTASLRLRMVLSGEPPTAIDPLLRRALVQQLETGQRFSRLWTQDHPNLDELISIWQEQQEATERWCLLQSLLGNKTQPALVEEAYHYALECYPYQKLEFNMDQERTVWANLIKNEQERFLLLSRLEQLAEHSALSSDCRLEGTCLISQGERYKLQPTLASLLTVLWDELPHSVSSLVHKVYGNKTASQEKIRNMSKRISELNNRLDQIWGKPENGKGRWIRKSPQSESSYHLAKFSGTLRN